MVLLILCWINNIIQQWISSAVWHNLFSVRFDSHGEPETIFKRLHQYADRFAAGVRGGYVRCDHKLCPSLAYMDNKTCYTTKVCLCVHAHGKVKHYS